MVIFFKNGGYYSLNNGGCALHGAWRILRNNFIKDINIYFV